jgi:O-antigen/teichoic acid export membrane protein
MLGVEGTGIFFLALTVVTIASTMGRLGLGGTLLRFTSARSSVADWVSVKGVSKKGLTMAIAASISLALAGLLGASWLANTIFSKPELTEPLRWMSLAIMPMALLFLYSELLKGLKRIFGSQLVHMVGVPVVGIPGIYLLGKFWGVIGAVWAYNLAAFLTALTGFLLWRSATPQLRNTVGEFDNHELLKSSIPLFWVQIMAVILQWMSSFLLGIWGTIAEVGIFNVALRTSMVTSLFLVSINSIAAPKYAAMYQQGEMKALGSTALNSTKMVILFASPVLLLFFLAPHWVMKIFGDKFVSGAYVLTILTGGQFINAITGSVSVLLIMSGNERLHRNSFVVSMAISVILNFSLVPYFGLLGAAIATAVGIAAKNIYAAYLVWVRLKINTIPLDWIGLKWLMP